MRLFGFFILFIFSSISYGISAEYYFGDDVTFDANITTPKQAFGYEVGEWHLRHNQIVAYLTLLAQQSPRISLETIGYSHQRRPLLLITATSADNQQKITDIQATHLAKLAGTADTDKEGPAIIWMGYSVHGNEPSGSNAAVLLAYYLAAAQGQKVMELLSQSVILIDPVLNPDGLSKFATWVNSNKSNSPSFDPEHREHHEPWPSSRTNHYWFDLNRDWLLLQHPESQARVAKFQQWKPHVLTDFHEMGSNNSYFFQPGIPSRTHPYTPQENTALTAMLAKFHARAFDQQGQLYFTGESFDDFYYGKGSTYPDINGSIGILFEQASSRGHAQETQYGVLTFPKTIKNQLTTSFSTFAGVLEYKTLLSDYQRQFYQQAVELAEQENFVGYAVAKGSDPYRFNEFVKLLEHHGIQLKYFTKEKDIGDRTYQAGDLFVPLRQSQYRLIKAVFNTETHFQDNTFYDVSGWTLPYAFDLQFDVVDSLRGLKISGEPKQEDEQQVVTSGAYAYLVEWQNYLAPKLANRLLNKGIKVNAAMSAFSTEVAGKPKHFSAGTLVVAKGLQSHSEWFSILLEEAQSMKLTLYPVASGMTSEGIDLGSRKMLPLSLPKVLLVGGEGVSQYEVGELWYHLDRHLSLAPTIVEKKALNKLDLNSYTHIFLVDGSYSDVQDEAKAHLQTWVNKGGVLWGQKRAAQWLISQQLLKVKMVSKQEMNAQFDTQGLMYADKEDLSAKQRIAGAIFDTRLDLTHPLAFGFVDSKLPSFKNSAWVMDSSEKPFVTVSNYTAEPLLAGYSHEKNVAQIRNSASIVAHRHQQGVVIGAADNPLFRGFWYGSSRIVNNVLFFSKGL
ncbi:M14 metallopeptidase family protein [Pseudoalteromonas sp. T1lg65]|uniref:M14 metallopeptidase family protein n=1 Tax=Pseudoalteromonas sp. T1lg65 TaxID=2077101 RepID=UPI003F7A103D